LVEGAFSIADITLYAYVHRAELGGFDLSTYAALKAWFKRMAARPAYISIDGDAVFRELNHGY
jgi:glutathione S-transferase